MTLTFHRVKMKSEVPQNLQKIYNEHDHYYGIQLTLF